MHKPQSANKNRNSSRKVLPPNDPPPKNKNIPEPANNMNKKPLSQYQNVTIVHYIDAIV